MQRKRLEAEYREQYLTLTKAARAGYVDDVIEPAHTRPMIIKGAALRLQQIRSRPPKKARQHAHLRGSTMSEIQQGLLIAAIGMGLVFAIIIFLWGLMALMMRSTSKEKPKVDENVQPEQTGAPTASAMEGNGQIHRATAAVAVGLALAIKKSSQGSAPSDRVSDDIPGKPYIVTAS